MQNIHFLPCKKQSAFLPKILEGPPPSGQTLVENRETGTRKHRFPPTAPADRPPPSSPVIRIRNPGDFLQESGIPDQVGIPDFIRIRIQDQDKDQRWQSSMLGKAKGNKF